MCLTKLWKEKSLLLLLNVSRVWRRTVNTNWSVFGHTWPDDEPTTFFSFLKKIMLTITPRGDRVTFNIEINKIDVAHLLSIEPRSKCLLLSNWTIFSLTTRCSTIGYKVVDDVDCYVSTYLYWNNSILHVRVCWNG